MSQRVICLVPAAITTTALCNNQRSVRTTSAMTHTRSKLMAWIVLGVLAAALTYATFRGYLSPELLLGFANTFSC